MCTVCGCGEEAARQESKTSQHDHSHKHALTESGIDLHFGQGVGGTHVPGLGQERIVQIETDILAHNNAHAAENRHRLHHAKTFTLNLVSSPGAGKTTLLTRTLQDLGHRYPIAVVEGDQQTALDAQRIREAGGTAVQVNTGKGCHLNAHMVGHALEALEMPVGGLLFIENVGNLVCPAAFDLGEDHKVVILSVTEGEDKPLKYPDMFAAADVLLINKIDLLPYVSFDVTHCLEYARGVNPRILSFSVSATTGQGLDAWYDWIDSAHPRNAEIPKR
ncbi:MAG: hydrogenase nickel incorporation protein HypB [Magnetospiraceae bacterium]